MSKLDKVRNVNPVTIELDGKVRTLKYDLNAFAELENRYGSVEAAFAKLNTGGIGAIRTILWAGLIHEEVVLDEITGEPIKFNITPYQVGGWIDPKSIEQVSILLNRAIEGSVPEENKKEAVAPVKEVVDPTVAQIGEDEKN
ncbi:hypothetical protein D3C75_232970 [compost metagenome]